MEKLDLCATFLLRANPQTRDPELLVEVSLTDQRGWYIAFVVPSSPAEGPMPFLVYVVLSVQFGCQPIFLDIVDTYRQPNGHWCLTVVKAKDQVPDWRLDQIGLCALGVVVDLGEWHGQTLACACSPAETYYPVQG